MTPAHRLADLMRQGFLKQRKPRPRKERPIVACEKCLDWHRQGQHRKRPPSGA